MQEIFESEYNCFLKGILPSSIMESADPINTMDFIQDITLNIIVAGYNDKSKQNH